MRSSSNPPGRDRHGWNRLDRYLAIHYGHIERLFDEGFLVEESLLIRPSGTNRITIEGRLVCQHGLVVDVRKPLEIDGDRVRTIKYKYHAALEEPHRCVFRYDNAHPWPGHPDPHHKHEFDPPGSPGNGRVVWVGYDGWPTLFEVVQELCDWWASTGHRLDLSSFPTSVYAGDEESG